MTKEEKQLLLRDICMRLPYGVNVYCEWSYPNGERGNDNGILVDIDLLKDTILFKRSSDKCTRIPFNRIDGIVKPYLRPMSSITEEEMGNLEKCLGKKYDFRFTETESFIYMDWLNAHHFDYRGMIEKGLALPALEGMYKF